MPYGPARGWSDHILGRQARELQAATVFADELVRPLLWRVHINWSRTSLGDDKSGSANAAFRQKLARWIRHPEQGSHPFYGIYVRERPARDSSGPNDHFHIHLPEALVERFPSVVSDFLPASARPLDQKAILIDRIGWTSPARAGALAYLLKGTAPKAAGLLDIDPVDQGRVYGKRCGVTETLGRAARERHARTLARSEAAAGLVA